MLSSTLESEERIEGLHKESVELTERCASLRKMNEELLSMLEKMHEKK